MSDKIEHLYWHDEYEATERENPTQLFGTWSPTTKWPKKKGGSQRILLPDCRHWRQKFKLQDGLYVFASAWVDKPTTPGSPRWSGFKGQPDIGFYLDSRWASERLLISPGFNPPFSKGSRSPRIVLYPWEDWGVPEHPRLFARAIHWLLAEARRGREIEIACMGGHGRTGTALACLLVEQGMTPNRAIGRVRSRYCEEAIESRKQTDFIRSLAG